MKRFLLSVSMALAVASTVSYAADGVPGDVKPRKGKADASHYSLAMPQKSAVTPRKAAAPKMQMRTTPTPKGLIYNPADGAVDFRAFSFYDTRIRSTSALVKFSSDAPNNYELVRDFSAEGDGFKYVGAATYGDNNKYYAYTMSSFPGFPGFFPPMHICEIDVETGNLTQLANLEQNILSDLTYDPVSGYLYALFYNSSQEPIYTEIFRMNPETPGTMESVARFDNKIYFTFSSDHGYLYAIGYDPTADDTQLVRFDPKKFNPANGKPDKNVEVEVIKNSLGVSANPIYQDMEIDKNTHRMFWWAQIPTGPNSAQSSFIEIDPTNGKILSQEVINANAQLVGLCAPYQYVADATPTMVSGLKVSAGAQGAETASIEWVNPTLNYQLEALSDLGGVEIFRDGVSVAKVTAVTPGQKSEWTDNSVTSGFHVYRVQPYNAAGSGIYKEAEVFVGHDLPAAPSNVVLKAEGNTGTLTWNAPTQGECGGWLDVSTLKYDVIRQPDNVSVGSDLTATTLTDQVELMRGYSYEVTAKNADGVGGTAKSNTVAFGSNMPIPFDNSLMTQEDFDVWTIVDNNHDGNTWYFSPYSYTQYMYSLNEADDYLFSPPLKMETGKQYQVRYSYDDAHWINEWDMSPVNERLAVHYNTALSVEGLNCIASHDEIHNLTGMPVQEKAYFTAKSNKGYVAFQCWSAPDQGMLYLTNISVREYSAKDASVVTLKGSELVNCNVEQTFNVIVGNEGSAPLNGYKVVLYDARTNEVLGEATGGEIEVGKTLAVPVKWLPRVVGDLQMAARVELDGDTYPADNVLAEPMAITVGAEDADKFMTVNTYDAYGWQYPFYLDYAYSLNQVIHLDNEIPMKNIILTGVQFVYNNKESMIFATTPVRISIKSTDQTYFPADDDYNVYMIEGDDWTVVYEGDIVVDQIEDDVKMYLPFDNEYKYAGGNIVVKYERIYGAQNPKVQGPCWQFCDCGYTEEGNRTAYFRSNKASDAGTIDPVRSWHDYFTPYTAFSYKADPDGIEGTLNMGAGGLTVVQNGSELSFNTLCEKVEVYDPSGALVVSKRNVASMSAAGMLPGVYVVRAVINGKPAASKFVVR